MPLRSPGRTNDNRRSTCWAVSAVAHVSSITATAPSPGAVRMRNQLLPDESISPVTQISRLHRCVSADAATRVTSKARVPELRTYGVQQNPHCCTTRGQFSRSACVESQEKSAKPSSGDFCSSLTSSCADLSNTIDSARSRSACACV